MFLEKEFAIKEEAQVSPDFTWNERCIPHLRGISEVNQRV